MKHILIAILVLVTANANAQSFGNINTHETTDRLPRTVVAGGKTWHNATMRQAHAAGWRFLPVRAVIPEGHRVVTREILQDPTDPLRASESITTIDVVQEQLEDSTSSLHAFVRFRTLVQDTMGVTLNSYADLVGKADDMLIAANKRLGELDADMDAANSLAAYKAANKAMASYQADLDRINLFMWAIQIRRAAGK